MRERKTLKQKKQSTTTKAPNFFNVSGDQTNPDGTTSRTYYGYDYQYFYRKVAVPGLKISDPLPLKIFGDSNFLPIYPGGSWSGRSNFSITDGYMYVQYGSGTKYADWIYTFPYMGNYKLFTYYGGKSTKKTKRNCAQVSNFSVSGDDGNEDAEIVLYSYSPNSYYYYRKIPVKNLRTTSLPDYQAYKKDTYTSDFRAESWASSGLSFFTDGYAWILYGVKFGSTYSDMNEGDFRVCFPEKVKKSKNHSKRYVFSVSGNDLDADNTVTYSTTTYYYRKYNVPGLKIDDQPNMRLMKKANFVSGFSEEAWTGGSYYISEDGAIYILYGQKSSANNIFYDTGTGDYRLFVYK